MIYYNYANGTGTVNSTGRVMAGDLLAFETTGAPNGTIQYYLSRKPLTAAEIRDGDWKSYTQGSPGGADERCELGNLLHLCENEAGEWHTL